MPSITIRSPNLLTEGPCTLVQFAIPLELENKLKQENKPIPKIVEVKALIDTGASHCVIQEDIPKKLNLQPVGEIKMNTPSTKNHPCYQYFMRMIIPVQGIEYEGVFTAAPLQGQNIDCLIGRDLLKHGILIYIGYDQSFTFSLI